MEPEERDAATPAGREARRGQAVPEDAWFSGHRDAERRRTQFPVELRGADLTVHGIAVDLSATGLLVGVPLAPLLGRAARASLLSAYATLRHTWEDGVLVAIPGHGTIGRARVARIVDPPGREHEVLLGLRFEHPLPSAVLERWGPRPEA